MSIEAEVKTYLQNYAGLKALIGDRISLDTLPEGTYPAVTFFVVSADHRHDIDIGDTSFQFDCWGTTKSSVIAVAEQIRHALQRYKGMMGSISVIQGVFEGENDLPFESDSKLFHRAVEIKITYEGV